MWDRMFKVQGQGFLTSAQSPLNIIIDNQHIVFFMLWYHHDRDYNPDHLRLERSPEFASFAGTPNHNAELETFTFDRSVRLWYDGQCLWPFVRNTHPFHPQICSWRLHLWRFPVVGTGSDFSFTLDKTFVLIYCDRIWKFGIFVRTC